MLEILCAVVLAYQLAILLRIVLSWFPMSPNGPMAQVAGFLIRITEPVLGRVRGFLPSTGFLDLSPLVVLLVLDIVVRRLILRCGF
jgi:YggT family protein